MKREHNCEVLTNLLVFESEDDLNGSSIESTHATAEAHELVQVGHPFRAGLRVFMGNDDALSSREMILRVLS